MGVIALLLAAGFSACISEEDSDAPAPRSVEGAGAVTASQQAAELPAGAGVVEAAAKTAPAAPAPPPEPSALLLQPAQADEQAPETCRVRFTTTKGDFVVEVSRQWAPHGADRFYTLAKHGYFTDMAFFRSVPKFVVQFGIHFDERVRNAWRNQNLLDDRVAQSNVRGTVTFAQGASPNSRTVQLFINRVDNQNLDTYGQGFPPIGRVVEGMAVVDQLYSGYGDMPHFGGRGPDPERVEEQGNDYLRKRFPNLDYIVSAKVEE